MTPVSATNPGLINRYRNSWTAALFFFLTVLAPHEQVQADITQYQQSRYAIQNSQINESSGLACSKRYQRVLWTHNDSGHMPIIYAMSDQGEDLGTFFLEDVVSRDWEDMASFSLNGQPYILIADSGDNFGIYRTYTLSIFSEPDIKNRSLSAQSPLWQIEYRFPDHGSYDVEAVTVDVPRNKILLLTKKTPHAILYEVPLQVKNSNQVYVAENTAEFSDVIHPTAMDITADGRTLLILTYGRIHFYESLQPFYTKDKVKYRKAKQVIKYKGLYQAEALCLSDDKQTIYLTSERKSRLLKIDSLQGFK